MPNRLPDNPNLEQLKKQAKSLLHAAQAQDATALQREDVQVLVIGEAREWETVEYVDDAVAAGHKKALILIGHIPSEQPGMDEATAWLKTFVTEVPVALVPAKDPFWKAK